MVVFFALSGVTNMLVDCMKHAASKNVHYRNIVEDIEKNHFDLTNQHINQQKVSGTIAKIKKVQINY